MDKVIEQFIKKEDAIEARIQKHIDARFELLDLDTVMQHPEAELGMFAEQLAQEVFKRFATECVLEGIRFAESVAKKKTVVNIEAVQPEEAKP